MRFLLWWLIYFALMGAATQSTLAFWAWIAWFLVAFCLSSPDPNPKKKKV